MNRQRPNISVIVPVYNAEKYLVKCLNSICNQEFSGTFEVIAVEASSTDNSLAILKDFQAKESRLKIIEHGTKEMLSTSRVTGMKASTGDYIMHVDSDDWLLPDALEKLFRICLETNADVVVFDYIKENNKGIKISSPDYIKKKLITADKLKVQHHFYGAVWKKIVKKSLTENMIYGEIGVTITEDLLYSAEILLRAGKICLLPESYYVYFVHTESATWVIKPEILLENQIITLQQIKNIAIKYEATSEYINNILSYLEKNIYLHISQSAFLVEGKGLKNIGLLNAFQLFPEMTDRRLNRLSLSMMNKYYSLFLVFIIFGVRPVFGIILRSIRKRTINT